MDNLQTTFEPRKNLNLFSLPVIVRDIPDIIRKKKNSKNSCSLEYAESGLSCMLLFCKERQIKEKTNKQQKNEQPDEHKANGSPAEQKGG